MKDFEILYQKGKNLEWDDFNNFSFEDIGSGIYIRKYKIEGGDLLLVAGKSLGNPPERIYIVDQNGKERDLIETDLSE